MAFKSILFKESDTGKGWQTPEPEIPGFFIDLNLNQVINSITSGKEEYDLKPFFYTSLKDVDAILYRQEIMQDMTDEILYRHITSFAQNLTGMRAHLPKEGKSYFKYQKERLFLDAIEIYCKSIITLSENLSELTLNSQGLLAFCEYLSLYIQSNRFTELLADTKKLLNDLSSVTYYVYIHDLHVQVRTGQNEADYSAEIGQFFDRFRQAAAPEHKFDIDSSKEMNRIEAQVLEGVAGIYPLIFQNLTEYFAKNQNYLDETMQVFDREIQFYVSYLEYLPKLKQAGLQFCYPEVSPSQKNIYTNDGFDIALAYTLIEQNMPVVCNDFYLHGNERIIVVSGPNQGGKTTFARTFGQLHFLASIGCPVPGKKAKLFLFDRIFTHFAKGENTKDMRSKLEDDLLRIHTIFNTATPATIIIMNEIFSSTTLRDSMLLSEKIMGKISTLDSLCVWVTFIDEITALSKKAISMVSTVSAGNPVLRTFKIVRKPGEGLAYALSIAEKYRLTYQSLKERIKT